MASGPAHRAVSGRRPAGQAVHADDLRMADQPVGPGVSVSMAAKAYRLLRAVLRTAVEEDKILPSNPCRVRGAGEEHPAERPVLTVVQVFELADLIGRRPVGNIRQRTGGGHRLRFQAWPSSSLGGGEMVQSACLALLPSSSIGADPWRVGAGSRFGEARSHATRPQGAT